MLDTLIKDLRATTKPKEKHQVVVDNDSPFLKYLLKGAYDPDIKFHVKIRPEDIPEPGVQSINTPEAQKGCKDLLEYCMSSNSNKQNRIAAKAVLELLDKGSQDLMVGVLNKSLKSGLSVKTINKIYKDLVYIFEVQLANSYLKTIEKKKFKRKDRWCSYKLDGVRCAFIRYEDGWRGMSRQGKEFLTIDHIKDDMEFLYLKTGCTFWDGELYVKGLIFEDIQGLVMSHTTGTSYELNYRSFITGDKDNFFAKSSESMQIVTLDMVDYESVDFVQCQPQWLVADEDVAETLEKAFSMGYEGIMLRDPDCLYDYKRSDALLKLKESNTDQSEEQTADCVVKSVVIGAIPVVEEYCHTDEEGFTSMRNKMVFKQLITKLIVEQADGTECTIGSGFNLEFRYKYTEIQEDIINRVVEIKFQGYGNKGRMRFPRLYRAREDLTWGE